MAGDDDDGDETTQRMSVFDDRLSVAVCARAIYGPIDFVVGCRCRTHGDDEQIAVPCIVVQQRTATRQ